MLQSLGLLFASNMISSFATGITMVAIPWYLLSSPNISNGHFKNTAMFLIINLLTLFWGNICGALVDRYNKKSVFQWLNAANALLILSCATLGRFYDTSYWLLCVVAAISIFNYNLHYPNLYAFVQEIVPRKHYQKVNSVIEIQVQLSKAFGMVLGALFISGKIDFSIIHISIETWPMWKIIALDGGTYGIALALISLMPYKPQKDVKVDKSPILNRIIFGFNYLMSRKKLLAFGLGSYVLFFVLIVFFQVQLPAYVKSNLGLNQEKGGAIIAAFQAIYSLGAITMGIYGLLDKNEKGDTRKKIGFLLIVASLVFFGWASSAQVSFLLIGAYVIGILNAAIRIFRITYLIRKVPGAVIGRVNSFYSVANVVMRITLIGILLTPFFSAEENISNLNIGLYLTFGLLLIASFVTFSNRPESAITNQAGS